MPTRNLEVLEQVLKVSRDWILGGSGGGIASQEAFGTPRVARLEQTANDLVRAIEALKQQAGSASSEAHNVLKDEDLLRQIIARMPLTTMPEIPVVGMAAADEGEGRSYDGGETGETVLVNATDLRSVTVRGDSAKDYAWDGQQALIDADRTLASIGKPCVILTRDGQLRLKRKINGDKGKRKYQSINPAFPQWEVAESEILAEWPVVGILSETKLRSPVETVDEGKPPRRRRK